MGRGCRFTRNILLLGFITLSPLDSRGSKLLSLLLLNLVDFVVDGRIEGRKVHHLSILVDLIHHKVGVSLLENRPEALRRVGITLYAH